MEITQDISNICAEFLNRYKDEIKNSGHNASGELASTASYKIKWDGKYFELYFNLQDYYKYLEAGTKPHFPPIDKIEQWVRVKPIVPQAMNGRIPSTKQVAYLIARSISIKGTKPTQKKKKTIDGADDLISALVSEISNQLEKEIDKEL